ncbi:hypothetical protein TCON_2386 [Astathelohania contejeani]|uniref:Uncharacterized protein n=1 Tax=Astathelohania contejeani TaxID=164912 RepID=A0ABQ7HW73_9MICR|nr:hypothetical protein TCON_2386 [Thelohania contejeani]
MDMLILFFLFIDYIFPNETNESKLNYYLNEFLPVIISNECKSELIRKEVDIIITALKILVENHYSDDIEFFQIKIFSKDSKSQISMLFKFLEKGELFKYFDDNQQIIYINIVLKLLYSFSEFIFNISLKHCICLLINSGIQSHSTKIFDNLKYFFINEKFYYNLLIEPVATLDGYSLIISDEKYVVMENGSNASNTFDIQILEKIRMLSIINKNINQDNKILIICNLFEVYLAALKVSALCFITADNWMVMFKSLLFILDGNVSNSFNNISKILDLIDRFIIIHTDKCDILFKIIILDSIKKLSCHNIHVIHLLLDYIRFVWKIEASDHCILAWPIIKIMILIDNNSAGTNACFITIDDKFNLLIAIINSSIKNQIYWNAIAYLDNISIREYSYSLITCLFTDFTTKCNRHEWAILIGELLKLEEKVSLNYIEQLLISLEVKDENKSVTPQIYKLFDIVFILLKICKDPNTHTKIRSIQYKIHKLVFNTYSFILYQKKLDFFSCSLKIILVVLALQTLTYDSKDYFLSYLLNEDGIPNEELILFLKRYDPADIIQNASLLKINKYINISNLLYLVDQCTLNK